MIGWRAPVPCLIYDLRGRDLMKLLATKGSTALIQEFERRSDLKIAREEISMVEIRKPS